MQPETIQLQSFRIRSLSHVGKGIIEPKVNHVFGLALAWAEQLHNVEAKEQLMTGGDIIKALRTGQLSSTALIFAHGAWQPLLEHEDFGVAASRRARIESTKRMVLYGLVMLGVLALMTARASYL